MIKKFFMATVCITIVALSGSCSSSGSLANSGSHRESHGGLKGSDTYITVDIPSPGEFTGIVNNLPFDMEVVIAPGPVSIKAYLPDNYASLVQAVVNDGNMVLCLNSDVKFDYTGHPSIKVRVPSIKRLLNPGSADMVLNGSPRVSKGSFDYLSTGTGRFKADSINGGTGSVTISLAGTGDAVVNSITSDTVKLLVTGTGSIACTVSCQKCQVLTTGTGNITVSGTATDAMLASEGCGSIMAKKLKADTGMISCSGVGDVWSNIASPKIVASGPGSVRNQ